jgi:hypothetical protein
LRIEIEIENGKQKLEHKMRLGSENKKMEFNGKEQIGDI